MNLKKQVEKSLQDYNAMREDMRHYDGRNWHAVNVKRYNDEIDTEAVAAYIKVKGLPSDVEAELLRRYADYDSLENMYWDEFIGMAREELKEWIKEDFGFNLFFLGRSGGWGCFEDNADPDELENEDLTADELAELLAEFNAELRKIRGAKEKIKEFNRSLNWLDWVYADIDNQADLLLIEHDAKVNDPDYLISVINPLCNHIERKVAEYSTNDQLKQAIRRNTQSIKKLLDNNATL